MRSLKQKKINVSWEQKEVIAWLFHHHLGTLHETLSMLLSEREAKIPDKCVAMYNAMSNEEKNEIILILSRYYNDQYKNKHLAFKTVDEIINHYSYN